MIEQSLRILEHQEYLEMQQARTNEQRIQTRSKYLIARSKIRRLLVVELDRLN